MPLEPGAVLHDRYRIDAVIGQGGMGAVCRALDLHLNVVVAVKENLTTSAEAERQFKREAALLATLRHPNLPRVTDHFTISGVGQYLVMDFIEGEDLRQRLEREGMIPAALVLAWTEPLFAALRYLHGRQAPIIHRDIKPGNIKITPQGDVVLVDFGLAKVMEASQSTTVGAKALTPGFSPPEQYGWGRTDPRTDIYALAATFYCLLTGWTPEDGLERAMGNSVLTPLAQRNPSVPARMAQAIEQAMAVRADERFQTVEEFAAALEGDPASRDATRLEPRLSATTRVAAGRAAPSAPVAAPTAPTAPRRARARWLVPALIALAVLGGGAAAIPLAVPSLSQAGILPWLAPPTATPAATLAPSELPEPTELGSGSESTATPAATEVSPPTEVPTATLVPTPAATPLGGGAQVAFVSERAGRPQVFLLAVGSVEVTQLTDQADGACQPAWSPDGQKLLFVSPCRENGLTYANAGIYMLDLASQASQPVSNAPAGDFDPAWSHDGTRIAFTSLRDGREHIYLMNSDGSDVHTLSRKTAHDSQASWSPDDSRLVFMSSRAGRPEIWLMPSDDGETQETHTRDLEASDDLRPDWSPDGVSVLFEKRVGGVPSIWVSVLEDVGFNVVLLTGTRPSASPRWSPDGRWVVFESWPDGQNHDIWIMTGNGGSFQRLTDDAALDYQPAWRPG